MRRIVVNAGLFSCEKIKQSHVMYFRIFAFSHNIFFLLPLGSPDLYEVHTKYLRNFWGPILP
jgi:hypothetical protein